MREGFYLGRVRDTGEKYLYDPDDLVTHAVILGMTGSGKTGLGIGLLEEAARREIPALVLDPKGDLTNLLLHFPKLRPEDFLPWVSAEEARRRGITREALAREKAELWQKGLARDGLGEAEIRELERVGYAVFTPGSSAGIPISILASLKAPTGLDAEALADRVAATASAILSLAGLSDLDPVQDREHILVSRILLEAWEKGEDLTLEKLILRVQRPPFSRLGVFDLETFFPERARTELALRLNALLASPGFALWTKGVPLSMDRLLYDEGGRPRHAVVYLAHLDDAERVFLVTLLLGELLSWTLRQSGTERLRALLYFDEVYGYLPPTRVPPSKPPLLRLLKQARAFGVGLVLATQNPVDLDYKALSNAGTWFIGRLQTEQDKARLLDGLESLAGGLERGELDRMISGLEKRVFVAKNVHEGAPRLFSTRWVMNYLAGPLGKERIPELNARVGARYKEGEAAEKTPINAEAPETLPDRPAVPAWLEEYFFGEGTLYPRLFAQAEYRVARKKYGVRASGEVAVLVPPEELKGLVPWEDFVVEPREELPDRPPANARYAPLPAVFTDARAMKRLERAFKDWVYQHARVTIWVNEALDLASEPDEPKEAFLKRAEREARFLAQEEIQKLEKKYRRRIASLRKRLEREKRELAEDEAELKRRKLEEMGGYLETVLALFGGRRRSVTAALSKRRMSARAAEEVEESRAEIRRLEEEIQALEEELTAEAEAIRARWLELASEAKPLELSPYKKDIGLEAFGLAWVP